MKKIYLGMLVLWCLFLPKDIFADRASDSLALVSLYNSLGGSSWTDNTGWLDETVWLEDWYGITTTADQTGVVETINLSDNNLSGTLPTYIGSFGAVTSINLNDNAISGSLPSQIGNLSTLETLRLENNSMSGSLPTSIGDLSSLTGLYLGNNSFSGNLPVEIYDLTDLNYLYLNDNQFTGSLSADVENFSLLFILDISNNNFSGSLPAELSNINYFSYFLAYGNGFTGTIPSAWGDMPLIAEIDLSNNSLTGSIPSSFDGLTWLQTLDVSNNNLSGTLPTCFSQMYSIANIYLANNNFSGSIPGSYADIADLQYLDISNNSLTGSIPNDFLNNNMLIELYLNGNSLSGNLPSVVTSFAKLKVLDLSENNYSGSILSGFGSMPKLSDLYLNDNNLSGTIPTQLGNSSSLKKIYLDNNSLTGSIPSQLGNILFLSEFSSSGNSHTGSFPDSFTSCIIINTIDVSGNQLSGTLPTEIGDFNSIKIINIANNDFSGDIPADLADNSVLEYFYAQGNDFTGNPDMTNLNSLKTYNIANNNLHFDDLETNSGLSITSYVYAPQDSVGTNSTMTKEEGDYVEMSFSVGGANNEYQWTKDGVDIPGANSDTYIINSYALSDDGTYVLEVTNTEVTGLTIYSAYTALSLGLSAPILSSPADLSVSVSLTPTLEWNNVNNADEYIVEVSDSDIFTATIFIDTIPDLTIDIPEGTFSGSITYYWRVKAANSEEESEWSTIWSFTTKIGTPDLETPSDNSLDVVLNPLINWSNVFNADNYEMQLASDELFADIILDLTDANNLINSEYQVLAGSLEGGVEYFWKARAVNASETGDWSAVWSFVTKIGTPDLLAPVDTKINEKLDPSFNWTEVDNADNYEIEISTDDQFGTVVFSNTTLMGTTYDKEPPYLNEYTQYYWHVKAKNSLSEGDWSTTFGFLTKLNEVTLATPSNGSLNNEINPDFTWSENLNASEYDFRISTDPTYSSVDYSTTVATNNLTLIMLDLEYDTEYFWSVKAVNGDSESNWTDNFSFRTKLTAPVLSLPANDQLNVDFQPMLSWNASAGAADYSLEVATDDQFSNIVISQNSIAGTSYQVTAGLDPYTQYFWRVKSHNGSKESNWSDAFNFTTKLSTPLLVLPIDNKLNSSLNPSFIWTGTPDANEYELRISTDQTFTTTDYTTTVLTNTFDLNDIDLDYFTTYYWSVKAVNGDSESDWSTSFNLTTILETPLLSTPADGSINVDFQPELTWNASGGANTYNLEISDDSQFNNIVLSQNAIATNSYNVSGLSLSPYTEYFWRVKGVNGGSESAWSSDFSFTTKLSSPFNALPADGSINVGQNPTFVWSSVNNAIDYDFRISTDNTFSTIDYSTNVSSNTFDLNDIDLEGNTEYFWSVKANNGQHESDWSSNSSFTTKLTAPVLLSPMDEAVNVAYLPELSWNASSGADEYNIEIATDAGFSNVIESETGIGTTSYNVAASLDPYTVYYWHVKAINGEQESNWSDAFSFRTKLPAPALVTPADEAINIDSNPDFAWNSVDNATGYDFRISTDETFASIDYSTSVSSTGLSLTEFDLAQNTTYFWSVKSTKDAEESDWSAPFELQTKLPSPVLSQPADMAVDIELITDFTWNAVPEANAYIIQISEDNTFNTVLFEETDINTNSITLPEGYLEGSTDYFWRVQAINGERTGFWSDVFMFTTIDVEVQVVINEGWNLISSNIIPENTDMDVVFNAISDDIVIVRNFAGDVYIPEFGINTIGNWNYIEGYKVYAAAQRTLTILGSKVDPENEPITLTEGLNLVPYLRDANMDITTALNSISDNIVMVKDADGNIYIPAFGINNIGDMEVGKAYWIYVDANVQLTYPAND